MKKPTSKDVAMLAGVSQSTVSFVINNVDNIGISEMTKIKVFDAAKKLGYGPYAKQPILTKNRIIAVFIPDFSNPYYNMLVSHIEQNAFRCGFCTIVCESQKDLKREAEYIKMLEQNLISGVIFGYSPDITRHITTFSKKVPIVVIGEMPPDVNLDVVGLNSTKAGYIMTKHLIDLGHRKFAFLALNLKHPERLEGIRLALKDNNIEDQLIVLSGDDCKKSDEYVSDTEMGRKLTSLLFENYSATAIIAVNDILASGVYSALMGMGISIPNDISVCGFDNSVISDSLYPTLTTIDHCLQLRSKLAIDILNERIDEKGIHTSSNQKYSVIYDPLLIKRNSTSIVKIG